MSAGKSGGGQTGTLKIRLRGPSLRAYRIKKLNSYCLLQVKLMETSIYHRTV
jgi:hypothetical protein